LKLRKWRVIAVLALLYTPVVAAQTTPNWAKQSPQTSPPPRFVFAQAYDSVHGQVVLFGGGNNKVVFNDTWVWDGSNWTEESPPTSPPARYGHTMTYDSVHGQVVLFGGFSAGGMLLNDTWVWDGSKWTQEFPQTSPPPRYGHAMVYDSAHGEVIVFGGANPSNAALGDTWAWDGSNWTEESPPTSPPARYAPAMAYDSISSQVVLFAGTVGPNLFDDTWVWDGAHWKQISPQTSPPARYLHAMANDSIHSQVVLFGGIVNANNGVSHDTWAWNGFNWTQERPQTNPTERAGQGMAYDSAHDQIVLFGGSLNSTALGDTWTWYGGALGAIGGVVSASAFGGFSAVAPGSWVEIYGSNLAPATQGWTGADFMGNNAPTSLNSVSVSIGGQAAFVDYISPTQVNAQLPSNIETGGTVPLSLTNANGTSAAVNLSVNPTEPGLLAPASFKIGANQYVVAQHADGTYVLPNGAIAGINSSPAEPGETIIIYGVGFGPVRPNIPAGEIVKEPNQLSASFEILFGQMPALPAQLPYFGLAPNFVGLYQFNVTVPSVANSDLVPLTFTLGGVPGAQTLYTAVNQ
jgi:uncharacterized protein (TIGR03437 family)